MKFDNQLRYATTILSSYWGGTPLHTWLKDFFRQHKQMGSNDRKTVSNMVYAFYRLGHAVRGMPVDQRILLGLFFVHDQPGELLAYFRPEWNAQASRPLEEKIALVHHAGIDFSPAEIFPWKDELSEGIDHHAFCLSFLRQPDLFLRIRPGYEQLALSRTKEVAHEFIPPFTLRLPNGTKVEALFTPDKEVVIQDYSSQRIAGFLRPTASPVIFWDACAASGGKSILAYDTIPGISITVSDIRESILKNLQQRFRQAGITQFYSFVADLTRKDTALSSDTLPYNLVLADVPCTGSGTWSRTPEELFFFNPGKILTYSAAQRAIVGNILPRLAPGAGFVYTTCSVFRKENEAIAGLVREKFGLRQEQAGAIKGYDEKADTMFGARFSTMRDS
ncbi:Fmu (Sun) domain-containing protein [Flavitalea sp. BT771]|uniref:Fmu (Sun) domain-containing protein n=1 Tax=Flavitalea sp. BT771 TaxID=3063329 RepID=UPI0026E1BF17|nr:Fmu (Sun) domain-containing protein [Flavitalea sp. BT771]MDO6429205.1 Fmu (Sun) domain-containing protein [Flavitalea sp. BT771]MDV6218667.1 Fmu (Sun) domain-containing protein [Flavitalea sp. BT771]